ncbi:uncharacterized protein RJT20DRAFT_136797 [Scheffersomyces xylosifermentans]|uniref:uncharacterized protein n=1 Tax=Scheffersomyces xylosifermentans TaxID=1304137 RepID=UPI00315D4E42
MRYAFITLVMHFTTYFPLVYGANLDQSRSCYNGKKVPFTGYRLENQLNIKNWKSEYHLLYCNDNKLIYDLALNDTIPWTIPISFSNTKKSLNKNTLELARRKSFALRSLPIYLPNTLVGAMYSGFSEEESNDFLRISGNDKNHETLTTPLLADNILLHWGELNSRLDFIVHVPLLSTPSVDSRRYDPRFFDSTVQNDWDKFISATESYSYNFDSRLGVRKCLDTAINVLNSVLMNLPTVFGKMQKFFGPKVSQENLFWKLLLISKSVSKERFKSLLSMLDIALSYD